MPLKGAALLGLLFAALLVVVLLVVSLGPGSAWGDLVGAHRFSLVGWERHSFLDKWTHRAEELFWSGRPSPQEGMSLAQGYFQLSAQAGLLRYRILQGGTELPLWEQELQGLTTRMEGLAPKVEEALEGQLSAVLAEEGLARPVWLGGRHYLLFPPVDFTFAVPPNLLIVSPRERIELLDTVVLEPELTLDEIEALEGEVEARGVSALVQPLGGIGSYPGIVAQGLSLPLALDTIAHEWLHHYFFFHPLGQSYWASYEMTTVNETAADIAGKELASLVYQRFYGLEKPEVEPSVEFYQEMRRTRLEVDRLLEEGQVEEAERFMEESRRSLVGKGYFVRRLNQAYFAYYGTYADDPSSVSPTGGELKALRERQPSLGDFIRVVAGLSSREQLQRLLAPEGK